MIYEVGDKVKIRENYILRVSTAAFQPYVEQRIQKLKNRTVIITSRSRYCSYDKHEPGYSFKEFPRLVFKESMIECLVDSNGDEIYISGCIDTRFEILDL
jgi:hypothetical protein